MRKVGKGVGWEIKTHSHVTSHGFKRGFIWEYLLEENAPYIVGQDECRTLREKVWGQNTDLLGRARFITAGWTSWVSSTLLMQCFVMAHRPCRAAGFNCHSLLSHKEASEAAYFNNCISKSSPEWVITHAAVISKFAHLKFHSNWLQTDKHLRQTWVIATPL